MLTKSQEAMEMNHEEITNEEYVSKVSMYLCFRLTYSDISRNNTSKCVWIESP